MRKIIYWTIVIATAYYLYWWVLGQLIINTYGGQYGVTNFRQHECNSGNDSNTNICSIGDNAFDMEDKMIKWSDVKIGVTPISKVIVIGKSKPIKGHPNMEQWTDRSDDMTREVIIAVMEWFEMTEQYEMVIENNDCKRTLTYTVERKRK